MMLHLNILNSLVAAGRRGLKKLLINSKDSSIKLIRTAVVHSRNLMNCYNKIDSMKIT